MRLGAIDPRLWARFQRWRARLAAKVIEHDLGRQFDPVLMPDPVPSLTVFYELAYTFFRIYLSLPQEQQQKLRPLAAELERIVYSLEEEG